MPAIASTTITCQQTIPFTADTVATSQHSILFDVDACRWRASTGAASNGMGWRSSEAIVNTGGVELNEALKSWRVVSEPSRPSLPAQYSLSNTPLRLQVTIRHPRLHPLDPQSLVSHKLLSLLLLHLMSIIIDPIRSPPLQPLPLVSEQYFLQPRYRYRRLKATECVKICSRHFRFPLETHSILCSRVITNGGFFISFAVPASTPVVVTREREMEWISKGRWRLWEPAPTTSAFR